MQLRFIWSDSVQHPETMRLFYKVRAVRNVWASFHLCSPLRLQADFFSVFLISFASITSLFYCALLHSGLLPSPQFFSLGSKLDPVGAPESPVGASVLLRGLWFGSCSAGPALDWNRSASGSLAALPPPRRVTLTTHPLLALSCGVPRWVVQMVLLPTLLFLCHFHFLQNPFFPTRCPGSFFGLS